jgi:dipeptidyl aminopeptidase/acylaminoacyl peptidase/tetratricopeptide (TPR) repeat protein
MNTRAALFAASVILSVAISPNLRADEPAKKPLTPEMAVTLRSESDLRFSPDGHHVAFVVSEPLQGAERHRHIWVLDVPTRRVIQFTQSKKSDFSPRWSPEGTGLGFLSSRGEQTQIYFLPSDGGEAYALTEGKRGIQSFEWSPDGKQIAFTASDPKTDADEKKEKDKDDAHVADKDDKRSKLWLFDVESKKTRELVSAPWEVSEFEWTPGGDRIIVAATDHPESDEETNRIFSVGTTDGKMAELLAPRGPFGDLKVSPDGKWIAYHGARVDGPHAPDLYLLSIAGGTPRNLTAQGIDRPIGPFVWRPDNDLVALAEVGFQSKLYTIEIDSKSRTRESLPVNAHTFDMSDSGDLAFAGDTATMPAEIWLTRRSTPAECVSDFNKSWKSIALVKPEFFRYKSFDGTEIEGSLLLPANYDIHSKLPLITLVHGGPTGAWSDSVQSWGQMLAARGYAIFYPNIRGSTGYGEKFVEMNRADWGGGDYKDVMAGVDALIARGVADPDRLGIGGWSYGGYMAEWAITQTNRFKASVSGAGMFDLIAEFETEKGNSYDEWFFGQPYETPDAFRKGSPVNYMKNAKTPTLILQGEEDTTDPIGQSTALYRALKHYGVKAELVTYPREPHGIGEEKHVVDMLDRILRWYDENLNPHAAAAPAATASASASSDQFGKVNFPTSCTAQVQPTIEIGVAQMHSFQYQQVKQTFAEAAQQDPHCAMAQWGKAMSLYYQLWEFPSPETLTEGRADIAEAQKLATAPGAATNRERGYIAAAAAFYIDDSKLSHTARAQSYSAAMERLHADSPNDPEAAAFYALSLISLAELDSDALANRKKAIGILDPLFHAEPDNPGPAHYLIHAADTPALASQALEAARAYAKIAPDSSHAIHMPSHIFRRLGLWQESIASNLAAASSAAHSIEMHMAESHYEFHPMDFLDYSYLQSGQETKARHLVEELKSVPGATEDQITEEQALFSARNALELHQWKEAASLPVSKLLLEKQGDTYLARAIGAARIGDLESARSDTKKLVESNAIREDKAKKRGETIPAGKNISQSEAEAWLAYAEGKHEAAIDEMRSAGERESAVGETPVAQPAREMLGDMFLELKRPADALAAYKAALKIWPNRFDSVYGAARAAQSAGNASEARDYFAKLTEISGPGADRPELREAQAQLAKK